MRYNARTPWSRHTTIAATASPCVGPIRRGSTARLRSMMGINAHLLDQRLQDGSRSDLLLDEFFHLCHLSSPSSETRGKVAEVNP